ncbi:MAG: isopentenyl phosphate kinase [Candidatus Micrarchaeota archaeon]
MTELYILKLGGSVCTDKQNNRFKVNEQIVRLVAREIKSARKKKKFRLIVVNGAGPFGHTNVHEYGINNGVRFPKDFEGMCRTAIDCADLNLQIAKLFWKEGLLAYPVPASAITVQKNKKIVHQDTAVISELFRQNEQLIPVLNGTFVADNKIGGSVVSGDATIAHLAKKLHAKKVLFGTDVNGVYTRDPKKFSDAKQIHLISKKNWKTVLLGVGESAALDVSGGMKGKLGRLAEKTRGIPIVIFDATKKGNTFDALSGKKIGTLVGL